MTNECFLSYAGAYVIVGLLTFGFAYNSSIDEAKRLASVDCGKQPNILDDYEGYRKFNICDFDRRMALRDVNNPWRPSVVFPAVFKGVFWPGYFAGKLAIKVTSRESWKFPSLF